MKRSCLFGGLSVLLGLAGFAAAGCGEDSFGLAGDSGGGEIPGGGGSKASGGAGGGDEIPPEDELEENFEVPAAVGRFLWAANPKSNRVALIDAVALEVQDFEGGFAPTYLVGIPSVEGSRAGAAVLNALSHDVTLFFLPEDADAPVNRNSVEKYTLPVHRQANSWRVGPKSRFGIAWSNARVVEHADPTDGFQDITVIDFTSPQPVATRLSVGFRPSQVFIDADEERAYVVSQPGITVIRLNDADGPFVERELFLPEQSAERTRDVSFTPDGALAFVRVEGKREVLIVHLADDDARYTVELPAVVTDLDLSADGSRAVAVMRRRADGLDDGAGGAAGSPSGMDDDPSRIAILPVPDIVDDPTNFTLIEFDELFGSSVVSQDGAHAVLFTNGIPYPIVSILDLNDGSHRELDLQAPVNAVFLTHDSSHAVALLSPPAGSTRKGAFSLVPVLDNFPAKMQGTNAPARFVALSADPARALITTQGPDDGSHEVYLARFPGLRIDPIGLPSVPIASGILPEAGKGFVAQAHPEGRVTFVDLEDGASRMMTGFELGGKVVE